jgi:transposase
MARFDLTDFEWSVIAPLLPNKVRGVKRVDDRRVLNGIFWRLRTGEKITRMKRRWPTPSAHRIAIFRILGQSSQA